MAFNFMNPNPLTGQSPLKPKFHKPVAMDSAANSPGSRTAQTVGDGLQATINQATPVGRGSQAKIGMGGDTGAQGAVGVAGAPTTAPNNFQAALGRFAGSATRGGELAASLSRDAEVLRTDAIARGEGNTFATAWDMGEQAVQHDEQLGLEKQTMQQEASALGDFLGKASKEQLRGMDFGSLQQRFRSEGKEHMAAELESYRNQQEGEVGFADTTKEDAKAKADALKDYEDETAEAIKERAASADRARTQIESMYGDDPERMEAEWDKVESQLLPEEKQQVKFLRDRDLMRGAGADTYGDPGSPAGSAKMQKIDTATDESTREIASLIAKNPSMQVANIQSGEVNDEDVARLFDDISARVGTTTESFGKKTKGKIRVIATLRALMDINKKVKAKSVTERRLQALDEVESQYVGQQGTKFLNAVIKSAVDQKKLTPDDMQHAGAFAINYLHRWKSENPGESIEDSTDPTVRMVWGILNPSKKETTTPSAPRDDGWGIE